ncbi:MAG: biotin synthase BioB [Deltaproteobacteria bacterium]|nr:biotin synthase BioB [Deltaproteobacteria bacterium]
MEKGCTPAEAREILDLGEKGLHEVLREAGRLRTKRHGDEVELCSIVNARSGGCSQDCAFCAQSSRAAGGAPRYPLLAADEIVDAARTAQDVGAARFSIVTSGKAMRAQAEIAVVEEAVRRIVGEVGLAACASLGCVDRDVLERLKAIGLTRYHHNVETGESYWPAVCTTRPYEDSRRVVRDALDIGLEVCSGGILGMGESLDQRVELLVEIRDLGAHAVALNFFNPIPGTPFEGAHNIDPPGCLKVAVAARMLMPDRDIRVCGGREKNLGDLQPLLFAAGVSGLMVGGYLTTPGRSVAEDLTMLRDLRLRPAPSRARKA